MTSGRSIRRRHVRQMGRLLVQRRLDRWIAEVVAKRFEALREDSQRLALAFGDVFALMRPAHMFEVGELATRDGSDVQRVVAVSDGCADFECIKAPISGWCQVGDVEHNLMRRYSLVEMPCK